MEEEGIPHPSYFEFLFGMGLSAFEKSDVEYIVLETGLGGRLDATNAFPCPALTVITSISLDHTMILGNTIEQIAAEKAGIIKEGTPVIFDGNDEAAAEIIRNTAREQSCAMSGNREKCVRNPGSYPQTYCIFTDKCLS